MLSLRVHPLYKLYPEGSYQEVLILTTVWFKDQQSCKHFSYRYFFNTLICPLLRKVLHYTDRKYSLQASDSSWLDHHDPAWIIPATKRKGSVMINGTAALCLKSLAVNFYTPLLWKLQVTAKDSSCVEVQSQSSQYHWPTVPLLHCPPYRASRWCAPPSWSAGTTTQRPVWQPSVLPSASTTWSTWTNCQTARTQRRRSQKKSLWWMRNRAQQKCWPPQGGGGTTAKRNEE